MDRETIVTLKDEFDTKTEVVGFLDKWLDSRQVFWVQFGEKDWRKFMDKIGKI